jgi:hypothetical protein
MRSTDPLSAALAAADANSAALAGKSAAAAVILSMPLR